MIPHLVLGVATTTLGRSPEVELEIDPESVLDRRNLKVLLHWEDLEFWPSVGNTVVAAVQEVVVDPQMDSGNKVDLTTSRRYS